MEPSMYEFVQMDENLPMRIIHLDSADKDSLYMRMLPNVDIDTTAFVPPHWHRSIEMTYVVKGGVKLRLGNEMAFVMRFMPKGLMKFDASPKSIARLRKMFNSVDSTPAVEEPIDIKEFSVKAQDGHDIPMKRFTSKHTLENAPILYFIHLSRNGTCMHRSYWKLLIG